MQVLSQSVSNALALSKRKDVLETSKFVALFDKFFDLLNVNNFTEGTKKNKPFLHPFSGKLNVWLSTVSYVSGFLCSGFRMCSYPTWTSGNPV